MRKILLLLMVIPSLAFSSVLMRGIPAHRAPDQNYKQKIAGLKKSLSHAGVIDGWRESATNSRVDYKKINYDQVPMLITHAELMTLFTTMRDSRFLQADEDPDFLRRITWLYPDDGCFARAAVANRKLEDENLTRPAKVFAFGNLMIQSPYALDSEISWWYHVAPIVGYMGSYYVLDPAIDPKQPMLVENWFAAMADLNEVEGVVCNSYTYAATDNCFRPSHTSDEMGREDISRYLTKEWYRISYLGFNPYELLGTNPPWL